jgi:hypothetical protein
MNLTTTGTGTVTFGSVVSGFQSLSDASVVDADVVRYTIESGTNYESGTGTIGLTGSTYTMARSPSSSSESDNSAINLGSGAVCFLTMLAEDVVQNLADLDNVSSTAPAGGQNLSWDSGSSSWVPASPSGGITSVGNYAGLPASPSETDLAWVQNTKALYIYDGTEWDRFYTGSQTTPSFTTDPPASLLLNTDGSNNVVTVAATDAEGFPITYEFDGFSGSSTYTESSLPPQISSLSKNNGVFTFTPSTSVSNSGTFTGRFKASDGLQTTAKSTLFQLSFGLANCYGFDITQTSSSNGYVIFSFMFVAQDGSNLHDDSNYASEVVYGANVDQSNWREGGERSTSVADGLPQAYMRTEMLATFGHTLPASGSGSHFNYGLVANSTTYGNTKTITWTTARTIKGILVTGDGPTPYFSGGYVTPYIGGNTTSDLSGTSYTLLQGTTASIANNRYYDFSA